MMKGIIAILLLAILPIALFADIEFRNYIISENLKKLWEAR